MTRRARRRRARAGTAVRDLGDERVVATVDERTNRLVNVVVAAALALLGVSLAALLATPPLLGGPVDPTGGATGTSASFLLRFLTWGAVVVAALVGGYVLYRAVQPDGGSGETR